jgi:hypothetical protein
VQKIGTPQFASYVANFIKVKKKNYNNYGGEEGTLGVRKENILKNRFSQVSELVKDNQFLLTPLITSVGLRFDLILCETVKKYQKRHFE